MGARTLIALACLVNLATGTLVGIALDRAVLTEHRGRMRPAPGEPPEIFLRELALTAAQEAQFRAVFAAHHARVTAIFGEVRSRIEPIRREIQAELRKVLTPEQLPRFEELTREIDARMDGPPHLPGPPPGGR